MRYGPTTPTDRISADIEIGLQTLESRIHEYENALRFYARHEHWMGVSEDAVAQTLFIAASRESMNGFSVAERVLEKNAAQRDSPPTPRAALAQATEADK